VCGHVVEMGLLFSSSSSFFLSVAIFTCGRIGSIYI
jgi:hypothetical protein